jgi:7-carboxy-7-deazaguanine synthase (Cx14CxxC type)
MSYAAKEIFYTLQGEGAQAGRAAVFCRFSGCNLWSGRETDRPEAICRFCDTDFVGVDGPGGGKFDSAEALAEAIERKWPAGAKALADSVPLAAQLLIRQENSDIVPHPFPQKDAEMDGAPRQDLVAGSMKSCPDTKWPISTDCSGKRFVVCTGGEPLLQMDASLIAALHARNFEIAVESNGTIAAPEGVDWLCVSPKAGAKLVQQSGDELKLVYPQPEADPAKFEGLAFRHFFLQPMDGPNQAANTELALRYCLAHPRWRLGLQAHKILGIR